MMMGVVCPTLVEFGDDISKLYYDIMFAFPVEAPVKPTIPSVDVHIHASLYTGFVVATLLTKEIHFTQQLLQTGWKCCHFCLVSNKMNRGAAIYQQTVGHPLNRLLFAFVYAMVLAPWHRPAVFIISLGILLVIYLFLFGVDPLILLGYVAAYSTGWVVGRSILPSYEAEPFGARGIPPGGNSFGNEETGDESDPYDDVVRMLSSILDAPQKSGKLR